MGREYLARPRPWEAGILPAVLILSRTPPVHSDGQTLVRKVDYSYDALDRLTQEFVIEKLGSAAEHVVRTVDYTYDNVGNRQTMRVRLYDGDGHLDSETLYTHHYDAVDRLRSIEREVVQAASAGRGPAYAVALDTTRGFAALGRDCVRVESRVGGTTPSKWSARLLAGLAAAAMALMAVPSMLVRCDTGRPMSRRARRRRIVRLTFVMFLALFMAVGPEIRGYECL